jgi:hypothetical protein
MENSVNQNQKVGVLELSNSDKKNSIEERLKAIRDRLTSSEVKQPQTVSQNNGSDAVAWNNWGWTNFENWSNL